MPPEPERTPPAAQTRPSDAGPEQGGRLQDEIPTRERLEQELRASQQRWRDLVEFAPDAMIIVDQSGRIQLVNAQTEALFGYERRELLGESIERIMPERYRTGHIDLRRAFCAKPLARAMGHNLNLYACRKNGEEFPVDISLSPIETEGELLIASAIRDMTDRKRAEEEKIQREKLQAVIEMAGAATHELSQPLQFLLGHLSLLEQGDFPADHPLSQNRAKINEEIARVFDILHQLNGVVSYKTQEYAVDHKIIDIAGAQAGSEEK